MKTMQITVEEAMTQLEELGTEKKRVNYEKQGAGPNQFGVGEL